MGAEEHRKQAEDQGSVALAIVTVSDTRTPETDGSGKLIRELAEADGHSVAGYRIVKDEPGEVAQALEDFRRGRRRRSCSTAEPASAAATAPTT